MYTAFCTFGSVTLGRPASVDMVLRTGGAVDDDGCGGSDDDAAMGSSWWR